MYYFPISRGNTWSASRFQHKIEYFPFIQFICQPRFTLAPITLLVCLLCLLHQRGFVSLYPRLSHLFHAYLQRATRNKNVSCCEPLLAGSLSSTDGIVFLYPLHCEIHTSLIMRSSIHCLFNKGNSTIKETLIAVISGGKHAAFHLRGCFHRGATRSSHGAATFTWNSISNDHWGFG